MNFELYSVLFSIKPEHCKNIAAGRKKYEFRKIIPKIPTPFKAYIYCTKDNIDICPKRIWWKADKTGFQHIMNGKVIGEFVCDDILGHCEMANADIAEQYGCVKREDILKYSDGKKVYGLHISNLIIYDKPKELSEFMKAGALGYDDWLYGLYNGKEQSTYENYLIPFKVTHPPQSYCYVMEVKNEQ